MSKKNAASMQFGPYTVEISNTDKVWFPKKHITKLDIVEYYKTIAPIMLRYLKDRPLTMHRFPDGITGEDFYQKNAPDYFPDWIERVEVKKEDGVVHHVVCQNQAALVYLANQGVLTPHVWLSTIKHLHKPDHIVFDLDVDTKKFDLVRTTALRMKELLESIGLKPFVKTTGSRGLHVVIPIKPQEDFDDVRSFAHNVAAYVAEQDPKNLTTEIRKKKRKGRLFIDIARNAYAQTAVCAYAVRARPGAPVATPIDWEEVEDTTLTSQRYTIETVCKRLDKKDDPWREMKRHARTLKTAQKKLKKL